MATDRELEELAESWQRSDLLQAWDGIKARRAIAGWQAGKAFEYVVIRAFQLEAADTRWPYEVELPLMGTAEQVDGAVYVDGTAFLIESKDLKRRAAIEAIAKLRFRLERRPPGTMAVLFSVNGFTLPAELFAHFSRPLNVLLWGGTELDQALASARMIDTLREKHRYAIERGWAYHQP